MKTKKIYILLLGALLSLQVSAERTTFKEQTENWLSNAGGGSDGGSNRPGITDEEPSDDPDAPGVSIGDALGVLLTLSIVYGAGRQMRRKSLKVQP